LIQTVKIYKTKASISIFLDKKQETYHAKAF